jgi:hypothetical protein
MLADAARGARPRSRPARHDLARGGSRARSRSNAILAISFDTRGRAAALGGFDDAIVATARANHRTDEVDFRTRQVDARPADNSSGCGGSSTSQGAGYRANRGGRAVQNMILAAHALGFGALANRSRGLRLRSQRSARIFTERCPRRLHLSWFDRQGGKSLAG